MFEMEDLPYKHGLSDKELEERAKVERAEEAAAAKRKRASSVKKRPQATQRRKSPSTKSQTVKASAVRTKKALPTYRLPGEQPRDRMGRFASKTGAVLKGAIFGTAHIVGGTVAAAQHGYKTVKGAHKRRKKAAGHGTTVFAGKPKRRRRKKVAKAKPVKKGWFGRLFG